MSLGQGLTGCSLSSCSLKKLSALRSVAADNIDHNPSSTTANDSFHGQGISLFQIQSNQATGESNLVSVFDDTVKPSLAVKHCQNHFLMLPLLFLLLTHLLYQILPAIHSRIPIIKKKIRGNTE